MSDTPNPEQLNWYKHLEPLEATLGYGFTVYTDGYIDLSATSFEYDVLVEGGLAGIKEDIDIVSSYPSKLFGIIRHRLEITKHGFNHPVKEWVNSDKQLRLGFQGVPTDDEAMFFIALAEATRERPVERVLKEIREWGGAVLALDKEPAEEDRVEAFKAKIDELHVPHYHSAELVEKMYESPAIRAFVDAFAKMKSAHAERFGGSVIQLMSDLPELQTLANVTMRLGRPKEQKGEEWRQAWVENPFNLSDYTIIMGITIAEIKHPDFVNRYPLKVVRDPRRELSPKDLDKLKLAVVPKYYERDRAEAKRGLWRSVAEAWD